MLWTLFLVIATVCAAWVVMLMYREFRSRTIRIDNRSFAPGDAIYYGESRIALPNEGAIFLRFSHRERIVSLAFERNGVRYVAQIPVINGDEWSLQFEQPAIQTSLSGTHRLRPV
jgi:hypothetical protein